jgi:uncharacterized protein (DUF433 family)
MLDWSQCPAVERSAGKLGGAWIFKGTRIPVTALLENLDAGASIDEFVEWFPGVTREQARQALQHLEGSRSTA